MNNAKFNPDESFNIIMYFWSEMEITFRGKFDGKWSDVGAVAGCMFNDNDVTFKDWEGCYKATFGKDPEKSDLLNTEQIFTTLIEFQHYIFTSLASKSLSFLNFYTPCEPSLMNTSRNGIYGRRLLKKKLNCKTGLRSFLSSKINRLLYKMTSDQNPR
jgi:hypothetical protein